MTGPSASSPGRSMALGKQMTVEYYDCDPGLLADTAYMEKLFTESARRSGATVIQSCFHQFQPQGVSGVVIISESHFAVHAWPEFDYAAVDIFTCGDKIDFNTACESLREGMHSAGMIVSSVMNRGIVGNNGLERLVPVFEDASSRFSLSWKDRFESTCAWGMLAAIDVYGIGDALFSAADASANVEIAVRKLAETLGLEQGGLHGSVCPCGSQEQAFCWESGMFSIHGRVRRETDSVYLDLFNNAYFDPRAAAECLMRLLKGAHYRMQVFIRQ